MRAPALPIVIALIAFAQGRLKAAELSALRQLFQVTGGEEGAWINATGWNSSKNSNAPDPCDGNSWFGIFPWENYFDFGYSGACTPPDAKGEQSLEVLFLDPRANRDRALLRDAGGSWEGGNGLRGELHRWTDVGQLTALRGLYMSHNPELRGTFPNGVSTLTKLRVFGVNFNGMHGTVPNLNNLTSAAFVYMNNMALSGTLPPMSKMSSLIEYGLYDTPGLTGTIPALEGLTTLEELWLYNTGLIGTIPDLSKLTRLQFLGLHDNAKLSGTIPQLNKLTAVRFLGLNGNSGLRGTIPDIGKLKNLHFLSTSGCTGLSGPLPHGLAELAQLQWLLLDNNNLNGTIPNDLPYKQYRLPNGDSLCGLGGNNFACPVPQAAENQCLVNSLKTFTFLNGTTHVTSRGPASPTIGCGCRAGYVSVSSSQPCRKCPRDTYSTGGNARKCAPCPAGTVTLGIEGATKRAACAATASLVFFGWETPAVASFLAMLVVCLAALDFELWQRPSGLRRAEASKHHELSNVQRYSSEEQPESARIEEGSMTANPVVIEMTTNPGAPSLSSGCSPTGVKSNAESADAACAHNSPNDQGRPSSEAKGTPNVDRIKHFHNWRRQRNIGAIIAAIDLVNFVIIVIDFTVFASRSVVAPVARLVLVLFFVKVAVALAVFALTHVDSCQAPKLGAAPSQSTRANPRAVAHTKLPQWHQVLRVLVCGGERYDVSLERGRAQRCCSRSQRTIKEDQDDFVRSLRFNAALGSLTFGVMCFSDLLSNGEASLEFYRLNDRPFGVTSLLNALAIVKASFAVFVNARVLELELLDHGSVEYIFVISSLALGIVRLCTTLFMATYFAISQYWRQLEARNKETEQLRKVLIGTHYDSLGDLIAHIAEPVRASVRVYNEAHRQSLEKYDQLPTLLKTYYVADDPSAVIHRSKTRFVDMYPFSSPGDAILQPRGKDVEIGAIEHLNELRKQAEEAQEILKRKLVPDYPKSRSWNPMQRHEAGGETRTRASEGTGEIVVSEGRWQFTACDPGIKGKDRCVEKCESKYKDEDGTVHYERLRDISRLSLIFDDFEDMSAFLHEGILASMFPGNVIRIDNRYFNPSFLGWRDVQLLVRVSLANNVHHICEIQLQHRKMADARADAHKHYEKIRHRLAEELPAEQHDSVQAHALGKVMSRLNDGVRGHDPGMPTSADVLFYCVK